MTLHIKAAYVEVIERILFANKSIVNLEKKLTYETYDLQTLDKSTIISLLQKYPDSSINEYSELNIVRLLTPEEYLKELEHLKNLKDYNINKLKKWCDSSLTEKESIINYLNKYNINIPELR